MRGLGTLIVTSGLDKRALNPWQSVHVTQEHTVS